jgi:hypothetical protein
MGCDIHAHVELKLADGRWHHWTAPHIDRNYNLFTKMAGVRAFGDEIVPIDQPRGLPCNVSETTRLMRENYGSDGHSDSWLSLDELKVLEAWWNDHTKPYQAERFVHGRVFELAIMGNYLAGNGVTDELPKGVQDVRIVFWFDN